MSIVEIKINKMIGKIKIGSKSIAKTKSKARFILDCVLVIKRKVKNN
jgi:hypothetical protein